MKVAVYGASGHTGRFVVRELLRRGHTAIAIGRSESAIAAAFDGQNVELRTAGLDSPDALDLALSDADAVVHCAGPFLDTARPMIEAALRTRIHYFDVTAEQGSARATLDTFDAPARERGINVVPAAGFFGGLGDLLATSVLGEWKDAERIDVRIALDSWWPTSGTRRTGQRNTEPRSVISNGRLTRIEPSAPVSWDFPEPFGGQNVVEVPLTETILIARHLKVREMRNYVNEAPLRDLSDPTTPGPVAADEHGRSNQRFVVDVTARRGDEERRITARGRDIYATTAPIVVNAVERMCRRSPQRAGGAFALAELVDVSPFLESLARDGELHLT